MAQAESQGKEVPVLRSAYVLLTREIGHKIGESTDKLSLNHSAFLQQLSILGYQSCARL